MFASHTVTSAARSAIAILLSAWALNASAGVFPRNGNFFITYNDLALTAKEHKLALSRNYNSKSTYVGWFGFGWGTEFEMRLTVMPDQTAVINESGGGASTYFHDALSGNNAKRIEAEVTAIMAAAKAKDKLDDAAAEKLRNKLMKDEEDRYTAVKKYGLQGELPVGARLEGRGGFGYCPGTLERTAGGYRRDDGCVKVDEFDRQGNLVKRTYKEDGYAVSFRVEDGHPVEIRDSDGQRIALEWNKEGRVIRATADGIVVQYEYDNDRNLVRSKDINGNTYRYEYDSNHDLTHIRYIDDSHMDITYAGTSGQTTSVSERLDIGRTEYTYAVDPENPNKYSTTIRKISQDGSVETETLHFEDAVSATGERWVQRMSGESDDDGGKSGPVKEMDDKGRVKRKTWKSGFYVAYTYSNQNRVESIDLNEELTVSYGYNANGDVTHVHTNEVNIQFGFDGNKKLVLVTAIFADGTKRDLRLKYDALGRLAEISETDGATAVAVFGKNGKIRYWYSDDGREAASRILVLVNFALDFITLLDA